MHKYPCHTLLIAIKRHVLIRDALGVKVQLLLMFVTRHRRKHVLNYEYRSVKPCYDQVINIRTIGKHPYESKDMTVLY